MVGGRGSIPRPAGVPGSPSLSCRARHLVPGGGQPGRRGPLWRARLTDSSVQGGRQLPARWCVSWQGQLGAAGRDGVGLLARTARDSRLGRGGGAGAHVIAERKSTKEASIT